MENIIEKITIENDEDILQILPKLNFKLKMGAQIIIDDNYRVAFIKDDQIFDLLRPGDYILSEKRIPKLTKYLEDNNGDKSAIDTKVAFINVDVLDNLKWGAKFEINNNNQKIIIQAFGKYTVKIAQILFFLKKLYLKENISNNKEIKNKFKNLLLNTFENIVKNNISEIKNNNFNQDYIQDLVKKELKNKFKKIGVLVRNFEIMKLNSDIKQINDIQSETKKKEKKQKTNKKTKQKEPKKKNIEKQEKNESELDKDLNIGADLGKIFQTSGDSDNKEGKICTNCGRKVKIGTKYCPYCGEKISYEEKYIRCNNCDEKIKINSKYCPKCGEQVKE